MGQYNWPMPGDADQGRTATVSHLKEEVRIMGNDPQVFSDDDDSADGLDVQHCCCWSVDQWFNNCDQELRWGGRRILRRTAHHTVPE